MLEIGSTAEASLDLSDRDMASTLPIAAEDAAFPEVFATSRMVALMELAAARLMKQTLQPGQMSVGVNVNIKHFAATPNHIRVWAKATFRGQEGKLYKFTIEAFDPGGKIGEGEHTRAIISEERLMQGARSRMEGKNTSAG